MKIRKIAAAAAAAAMMLTAADLSAVRISPSSSFTAAAASISDMPSDYQYAADWIWNNRIVKENSLGSSTGRYNNIFDMIVAGKGTINYVVKWQSYSTVTYEQRQQFETMLSKCINDWNDWLAGYENWPYEHIDVKVVGWAVIDKSCLLDLHDDEVVYTDTKYYDAQYDTTNGRDTIPDKEPYAPSELSRFDHFSDRSYEYPGGLDKRFDMYMWATQGFPDIGGCGGDWGQRLSDTAYLGMLSNGSLHVLEHEIGHGFGMTDFYGGEGESDGFPPGGFPGGENSIMMAGSAAKITDFDGWMLRYMWTKIKDEPGRFDLANAQPVTSTTTAATTTSTTTTASPVQNGRIKGDVNADGSFSIADIITMQNWLLRKSGTYLADWEAGDLCSDGVIDIYDLILLRRLLLEPGTVAPAAEFIDASIKVHGASLNTSGEAKMVIFYVDFPDCRYDYAPSEAELDKIAFGSADAGNVCYPFESFSAFYGRASKGNMQLSGKVFRYTTKENQAAYDDNKVKIAEECYDAFSEQTDFAQFDGDGDGRIDCTLFTTPTKAGDDHWWPCAGAFGDPSYRVDGVGIGHIITGNAQVNSLTDYVNFVSSYCHEMGHCAGLPDYYLFTTADSEGMHGAAGIELMDTDAGTDFGAFSKLMLGFYTKDQVEVYSSSMGTKTYTLRNAQTDNGNCVIIPYQDDLAEHYFSEFFIIEYASQDGNNSAVPWWQKKGSGVRVYHIDATTEYGWNTYFRYASGSEFTNSDNGRRLIRIIDDSDTDNFYHSGDVITNSISGFNWYDSNAQQTVDPGLKITIGQLENDAYTITISSK